MVSVSFHVSQDSEVVLIIVLSTGNLLESGLKRLTQSHCRHWHQSQVEIQRQIKGRFYLQKLEHQLESLSRFVLAMLDELCSYQRL